MRNDIEAMKNALVLARIVLTDVGVGKRVSVEKINVALASIKEALRAEVH
jgi:hypothetical protein